MTDRDTYHKIPDSEFMELRSSLNEQIGRTDRIAGETEDELNLSPEDYEKAYKELRQEVDNFLDGLLESSELHFE
jgi:hypothetical protein